MRASIRVVLGLLIAATPAAAQNATSPFLPYHVAVGTDIPDSGAASAYPLQIPVSGLTGTVGRVAVVLQGLTHTATADLDVLLVSPSGKRVMLISDISGALVDGYVVLGLGGSPIGSFNGSFAEGRPTDVDTGVDDFPAPAPSGPYGTNLDVFADDDPNGVWQLFIVDDRADDRIGSLGGVTLMIEPRFRRTTLEPVPPSGTTGVTESLLRVRGLAEPITQVEVAVHIVHPRVSDLSLSLVGPDGTTVQLANHVGGIGANFGAFCDNATTFTSGFGTPSIVTGTAPFLGRFAPQQSLEAFSGKRGDAANGLWTLRISDDVAGNSGGLVCWSLAFRTEFPVLAPVNLTATAIAGNQLSLWWLPSYPVIGSDYLLEGGIQPGQTLAQVPLGPTTQATTVTVPSGVFYVRVRGRFLNGSYSRPSSEIRVAVNVPVAPSPPKHLRVTRNGSSVDLSWTNTYDGGAPTALALDVGGAAAATIPLPFGNHASVGGVPTGNYVVRLRALNAAGSSAPTAPEPVAVPTASCSDDPSTPTRVAAYAVGRTIFVRWEQPDTGGAATSYAVTVTGPFIGSFTTTRTQLSAPVGPGTYDIRIAALNRCGSSANVLRTVRAQ